MFYLYKSLDNGHLFTNPVEIPDPELINVEYLGTTEEEMDQGFYELVDGNWVKPSYGYDALRSARYPKLAQQLDLLWHDIDNGLLGEQAKTGGFYQSIQAIKHEFPKTDK